MIDEKDVWALAHVEVKIDGEWKPAPDAEVAGRALQSLTLSDRSPVIVPDPGKYTVVRFKLLPDEVDDLEEWGDLAESNEEYRFHAWLDESLTP